MKSVEVLFTPADFESLEKRNLNGACCVVFDVLRATSTMVTALANGALGVIPVATIPEAIDIHGREPRLLLAGERDGVRIRAASTGGTDFDLGNSPREFSRAVVAGRKIAMTTTNGTRALRACARASSVVACSFLNLQETATFLRQQAQEQLFVVCSGTREEAAYEDTLGAGALCELVLERSVSAADSAIMAMRLFRQEQSRLVDALGESRNGQRLAAIEELRGDLAFCAQVNKFPLVAELGSDGLLRKRQ